jgi:hypothetical protein
MSRSGYNDDCDGRELALWRSAVQKAIGGRRGQAFLQEMADALDLLEHKRLIRGALAADGEVCALGAVAAARDVDVSLVDHEDSEAVAHSFGIARAMAAEIAYMNDERFYRATPEERFVRMREWVTSQIKETT